MKFQDGIYLGGKNDYNYINMAELGALLKGVNWL